MVDELVRSILFAKKLLQNVAKNIIFHELKFLLGI